MTHDAPNPHELILRDHLARDRTKLANERTLLAYIRTAFMLFVAGATALKVFVDTPGVVLTAWLFIGLGVFVGVFGAWRFVVMRRRIDRRPGPRFGTEDGPAR
jgi:inner membrane protein YidH